MGHEKERFPVRLGKHIVPHDVARSAGVRDTAVLEYRDPIAHERRAVDVVGDRHDGDSPFAVDAGEYAVDVLHMARIEECGGFVEKEERRFLRKSRGDERGLALPAAEGVEHASGKMVRTGEGKRALYRAVVVRPPDENGPMYGYRAIRTNSSTVNGRLRPSLWGT